MGKARQAKRIRQLIQRRLESRYASGEGAHAEPLKPVAPAQSPWDAALAAEPEHGYAGLRHGLDLIAKRDSEWAGIPMPMDNNPMVIDRKFPNAEKLMEIGLAKTEREEDPEFDGATVRNRFWSWNRRSDVSVIQ